jgi:hypothetical protein
VPVRAVTHGDSRSVTEQAALHLTCAAAGLSVAAITLQAGARLPPLSAADASLNGARYGIGSVAIACATGGQLGEVVKGDVPDDFDDELGREFGGGVV